MEVKLENGKLVVRFKSTTSPKSNTGIIYSNRLPDETDFKDYNFREWQKNILHLINDRVQRSSESNREALKQILIRKKMNPDQDKQSRL
jgi:hypothetical protein